ncbi:MAG: signal peptide peptidase SppA [Vampirovibrionales bacterium]
MASLASLWQHVRTPAGFGQAVLGLLLVATLTTAIGTVVKTTMVDTHPITHALEGGASTKAKKTNLLHAFGAKQLALVKLNGVIDSSSDGGSFLSSESSAESVRKQLDALAKDDDVLGVLLVINSPGGTVGMSQELNAAVQRVRQNKPVVASLQDVAASGGYYTAVACDKIITNPGTLTASIGVVMHGMNLSGLTKGKLGIEDVTITSGKFKDILNQFRPMRDDERQLLKTLIMDTYGDFLAAVLEGRLRGLPKQSEAYETRKATLTALADGRVVTGNQAVKTGLADKLGDWRVAQTELELLVRERFQLANNTEFKLETFKNEPALLRQLGISLDESSMALPIRWQHAVAVLLGLPTQATASSTPAMPSTRLKTVTHQPLWLYE